MFTFLPNYLAHKGLTLLPLEGHYLHFFPEIYELQIISLAEETFRSHGLMLTDCRLSLPFKEIISCEVVSWFLPINLTSIFYWQQWLRDGTIGDAANMVKNTLVPLSWWCHNMETLLTLLTLCVGNPLDSPHKGPVVWIFSCLFAASMN